MRPGGGDASVSQSGGTNVPLGDAFGDGEGGGAFDSFVGARNAHTVPQIAATTTASAPHVVLVIVARRATRPLYLDSTSTSPADVATRRAER